MTGVQTCALPIYFTFNLGSARLQTSTLLQLLNSGNYDAAAKQLLRWDHSGSQEIAALETRREAEYRLWTGETTQQTAA